VINVLAQACPNIIRAIPASKFKYPISLYKPTSSRSSQDTSNVIFFDALIIGGKA
jgi:hypothetical protein